MSDGTRLKILVVDDERSIADTLAAIFAIHGYEAFAAYSGESGLEQARSLSPDVVVSDVLMPGINGAEMAMQILQFLPSCKILLISGQAATSDLLSDVAAKGYTFELLPKPIRPLELLAKLTALHQT